MKRTKTKLSSFMAMVLFASSMTISPIFPTVTALAATDTSGHWAESTINKWTANGYINGYPDGTFRPNNAISRAEFVTLANKAFAYNTPTSVSFKDVDTSHWAYNEIQKGVAAGYIKGDTAGTFRPGAAVTRQEAAVMMAQIKNLQNTNSAANYTDYNSIANWAKPYVGAVSDVKIMQGFPNGSFRPQTSMTRAEAVTALENAIFAAPNNSINVGSNTNNSINVGTNNNINVGTNNNTNSNTNNNTNSSTNNSTNNTTTNSDYTLEDSTLRNKTVNGDLIIPSSMNGKTVTLNNVTVKGTVKVQGGSTIRVQSCDLDRVELDKSGVVFNADTKTKIRSLEFLEKGKIEGSGYENVYVQDSDLTEATIDATVNYLELDTDANLKLYKNADINTLEVTSNAKDGEVTFTSGSEVDEMNIRGRIRIYGRGDINEMTTYVSGIRSSIKPDKVTTRGDGEKPSYTSGESGSSSSSSGSNYDDLTIDRDDRKFDADGERYHNVSIEADNTTFRDAIVYNRLTITRDVKDGEVLLDDITVRGDVYIYGGGENSVVFRDCDIQGDIISDKDIGGRYGDEPVALEFEDGTKVGNIKVRGETIIRAESGIRIGTVTVDRNLDEDFIIDGTISTLNVYADCDIRITGRSRIDKVNVSANRKVTFRMESGSRITTLDSSSDVVLRGNGTVSTIKTDKNVTKDSGIVNDTQTSTFVAVTDILGMPTSITTAQPVTLNPIVVPSNASYKTVKWSIDSTLNTAGATISNDSILNTTKAGQVRLNATIDNGKASGTAFTKSFTITVTDNAVTEPAKVENINASATSVKNGDKIDFIVGLNGTLAANERVTWESSNTDYISVTGVTGSGIAATATVKKADTTNKTITITAKVNNGDTGKSVNITIEGETPTTPVTAVVKSITLNGAVVDSNNGTAIVTSPSITLGTAYNLNGATVLPNNAPADITWTATPSTGMNYTISDDNYLTASKTDSSATIPNSVEVIATIPKGAGGAANTDFVAKFNIPIANSTTPTQKKVTNITINDSSEIQTFKKQNNVNDSSSSPTTFTLKAETTNNALGDRVLWSASPEGYIEFTSVSDSNYGTGREVTATILKAQKNDNTTVNITATIENVENSAIETPKQVIIEKDGAGTITEITGNFSTVGNNTKFSADVTGTNLYGKQIKWNIKEVTTDKYNASEEYGKKPSIDLSTSNSIITVTAQVDDGTPVVKKFRKDGFPIINNIGIVGNDSAEVNNAQTGNTFTATANLNETSFEGCSMEWSFVENVNSGIATIVETEENVKIATIEIKSQPTTETELTVQARILNDGTPVSNLVAATQKITIASSQGDDTSVEPASAETMQEAASSHMINEPQSVEPQQETKVYVKDITLPTQVGEAGKNFDLSQANIVATGDNDFVVTWIVKNGFAEVPDNNTVRMDRAGRVVMTAVVNNGAEDGSTYTKDFEITFTEPVQPVQKVETPAKPDPEPVQTSEEPAKPEPVQTPEEPSKSEPVQTPEEPAKPEPVQTPEEPSKQEPVQTPEEPSKPEPVQTPEEPSKQEPVQTPEEPAKQEPVQTPEEPAEPEPVQTPEEPAEPEPTQTPEEPVEPEPAQTPEEPAEPEPVQTPEEPSKQEPVQTPEEPAEPEPVQTPETPVQTTTVPTTTLQTTKNPNTITPTISENNDVIIVLVGKSVPNSNIALSARNLQGASYSKVTWSIEKDNGTNATLTKNVLVAKNAGTVVVKATIQTGFGSSLPKIATKMIVIQESQNNQENQNKK